MLKNSVSILGIPTDVNSSYLRGSAKAPPVIRAALWNEGGNSFTESGLDLRAPGVFVDAGDLVLSETPEDRATIEGGIGAILDDGSRALALGGDHSITFPIVAAYAKRFPQLRIVHIDAHPDLYPEFQGNRYSHACPFARILEETSVQTLVQIGIRTMSDRQRTVAQRFGVKVFGPSQLAEAASALPSGAVYVTLDLDGLDPAFAPGVSHREPGGLTVREALDIVRRIPGTVVGADIVELNPDEDVRGVTAGVAAKFAKEFIDRMQRP